MEDDDEFGDLYTDVLRPFTTPSQVQQQHQSYQNQSDVASAAAATKTTSLQSRRPIDLNNNIDSDDDEILYGAPNSSSTPKVNLNNKVINFSNNNINSFVEQETLPSRPELDKRFEGTSGQEVEKEGLAGKLDSEVRVLDKSEDVNAQKGSFGGSDLMDEGDVHVVVEEIEDKDENLVDENEKIVVEKGDGEQMMIPGLSTVIQGVSGAAEVGRDENFGDEYDSDSEDDLQIVLNNDNELGAMGMERMGGMEDEDDDDGDPLVIVADNDDLGHQPMMEDQEWGEEAGGTAGADGERKELGDSGKANGGVVLPPKVFNSHPYHHPFHSQFKYVRPGITPIPGPATGGTPSQVRPPVNVGPAAGRGRGDWRPAGRGGGPMQKVFHPGYGVPWGSNTTGRGLDFTLPSHKTIFEVDIDGFEEKPWKLPGIDVSDFFNFGLSEESWKEYCKQLEQHRLETTMQSRIRVYESGRTEQEYDPDLPPELAAASGIPHISSENADVVKIDASQNDPRGSSRGRPPLPTGRPILVETNYTDRLPSVDTRQQRIRDSDAIIEIICQDSAADQNDTVKQEDDVSREDLRGSEETEDHSEGSAEQVDDYSHAYNNRKKEFAERKKHVISSIPDSNVVKDEILPPSGASMQRRPGSRERTPIHSTSNSSLVHEERIIKGKACEGSPKMDTSRSTRDKQFADNTKDGESSESIDGKPLGSHGAAEEENVEDKDTMSDEFVQTDTTFKSEREDMAVDMTIQDDMIKDENLRPSSKKQKLNSPVGQPSPDIDGEDSRAARSSENSKARSGSSKDYRKQYDGIEEEVVQGGRSTHIANIKRSSGRYEDVIRKKVRDERQETDRHRTSGKGREDAYSRKGWDPNSSDYSRVKTDIPDRRRENDNAERARQRIDEDFYGRRARVENTRKRENTDEMGSRHLNNTRESERTRKIDHHQGKDHLDNGSWRFNHDKDMGSKHREREDSLKIRDENMDNLHSKRRKEEALLRREQAEREEILHGQRENSSRRKRERDDILDLRKRDDQRRLRDDDMYIVRHKEEGLAQRERGERQRDRDEWHRPKHPQEEILSKREREEGRVLKSVRPAEQKAWVGHSRGKEEYRSSDRDYYGKDIGQHSEQPKRRDRVENESLTQRKGREDVHAWSNHGNNERKARHERTSARDDSTANETYNQRVHEKKQKETIRKGKESEGGDQNSITLSRRNQDDHGGLKSEMVSFKGKFEQGSGENEVLVKHPSSIKHSEEVSSDDEQSHSRRGRSKLERWASHKERDFAVSAKSSSSVQIKENSGPPQASKLSDEPPKPAVDEPRPSAKDRDVLPRPSAKDRDVTRPPSVKDKDVSRPPSAKDKDVQETNNVDVKVVETKQLDTVEKLKKRSERFKLPMPSEKEATTTKKTENEPLPSAQPELRQDTVIKSERPARKRRWTSN